MQKNQFGKSFCSLLGRQAQQDVPFLFQHTQILSDLILFINETLFIEQTLSQS